MPMSHSPSRRSSHSRGHGVQYTTAVGHADPLGGGEKAAAEKIYERLRQHGLTHEQAVGILGNLQVEAPGFDTGAWNGRESSYGLAQWRGGRLEGLYEFAAQHPLKDPSSWEVQVDYIVHELHTSESNAYAHLQTAQTPTAAATAFDQFYERSSGEHRGRRIANANQFSQTMRLPAPGSSFQSERPAPDVSQMA
ncbi:phage tail tip lysozyme [Nocardia brevicatena]|uniref:phage tail tip lysozyme n=1 Tax=Nocardia brevicatena TaxID=37327 RepID=UPI003F6849B0